MIELTVPRRYWVLACVTMALPSFVLLGTMIKNEDGDPWICTSCWVGGHHHHASEGSNPSVTLQTIYQAEQEFIRKNPIGDFAHQYWRSDVAGLYAVRGGDGVPLKLIELSTAAADGDPKTEISRYATSSAKNGFRYRSIRHAVEDPAKPDPQRFAFCVYPEPGGNRQYIYILDERQRIFRIRAEGHPAVDVFPADEELKAKWTKLD